MKKVLVLEDDADTRSLLAIRLRHSGYEAVAAAAGAEALDLLQQHPDIRIVLLDCMLPDMDGLDICRQLRAADPQLGIIILSARSEEADKIAGLRSGADDYVTKPFSPAELMARIDALFRRIGTVPDASPSPVLRHGPFLLNIRSRTLEKNGVPIRLTQTEYSMIRLFLEHPGRAISREEILNTVWGSNYFGELKIVDVNIRRLRIKIEDDPKSPVYIVTEWGYGYKWNALPASAPHNIPFRSRS